MTSWHNPNFPKDCAGSSQNFCQVWWVFNWLYPIYNVTLCVISNIARHVTSSRRQGDVTWTADRRRFGTSWGFPFINSQRCLIDVGMPRATSTETLLSSTSIRCQILTFIWHLIVMSYFNVTWHTDDALMSGLCRISSRDDDAICMYQQDLKPTN